MYVKWGHYRLIHVSENIYIVNKLQKETKLDERFCKFLTVSLFPLESMVIEVQNLIDDWKLTRYNKEA